MSKVLRVPDYLEHILKAIERIDRYTADMDEIGFLNSELVQDAVIRNIEIIGEASNNIQRVAPEFAAQHDNIPWRWLLCGNRIPRDILGGFETEVQHRSTRKRKTEA